MVDMTIIGIKSGLPEYNVGESVNLVITVRNDDLPAISQIRIYDRVTGKLIQGFGSFLLTNETFNYVRSIGAMPEDNLKLTITVNGKRKDFEIQLIGAEPVIEEVVEEEEIIEEEEVTPKEEIFKEPVIYRPDIYEPIEIKLAGLPWYVSWLSPLSQFFGSIAEGITNHFSSIFTPLYDFFGDPIDYIVKGLGDLMSKGTSESINSSLDITALMGEGSPDWLVDLRANIDNLTTPLIMELNKAVDVKTYEESILSPEQASIKLNELRTNLIVPSLALFGIHAGIESASLGQFEWFKEIDSMVISKLGINTIIQKATLLPIEKSILIPAEQHYNYMYTPEIPTYTDLIKMVVKEKITLPEFKMYMRLQGYSADFSQKIWDSHFIAPSLGNLLTSFRRGTITEEQLTELQILVDLDPLYNNIWFDQRYRDPTPRQARWMFEAGAIDEARVKNIVERSGLLPDDVDPFTEYLITFNERQWKRRYILEIARGYRLGKISEDELRTEIFDAYHSKGIADWIVKTEEKALIIGAKEPVLPKIKLLTVADWKKAYIMDKIDKDKLRIELLDLNYEPENIDILIATIDEDKIAKVEGAKVVRLTKAEMLQAFKQEEIDEDDLRIYLFDLGLDMLEVNILINTKKKQWGLVE